MPPPSIIQWLSEQKLKTKIMSSCHIQSQAQDFWVLCFSLSSGSKAVFHGFGSLELKDKFNHHHHHPQHPQDPMTKGGQKHCTVSPIWQGGEEKTMRSSSYTPCSAGRERDSPGKSSPRWVSPPAALLPPNCKDTPYLGISMATSEEGAGEDSPPGGLP